MQQAELYINNTRLDLPSDSLVALSYAVNTLTDLKSVQGNISNSISLPDTANNRAALGYPNDLNFNGAGIIRQKIPCRYVQNGVDVIPQGNLRITGASKGAINVVITCGNTDFFDLLNGNLRDLDLGIYDHYWNHDSVAASWANTEGYIYPIINYGNLFNDTSIWGTTISTRDMRPAAFVKTVIDKIVTSAGYTLVNKITDDPVTAPIYDKLLLPFSSDSFEHSNRFILQAQINNLTAQKINTQTYVDNSPNQGGSDELLRFDHIVNDPLNTFDGTYFTAPQLMVVDVDFAFDKITSSTPDTDHLDGAYYELYTNAGGIDHFLTRSQTNITNGTSQQIFNKFQVTANSVVLQPGEKIWLNIGKLYGCTQTISPNVTLTIKRSTQLIYGENAQIEAILPDMSSSDFLKFISFLFCAIIQTDNVNKVVTIVPFGHIIQNMPHALDWSSKVVNDDEDYDVQISDYCQQNEAKWQEDDTVAPDTYGNGSFYLTDKNLDLYQDIYDIPFAASLEKQVLGNLRTLFINKIPNIKGGVSNMETQTEQRICLLNPTPGKLTYREDDTPTYDFYGILPLAFFTGSNTAIADLTLTSIFKNHYTDLVNVLNDQRKLTCYLRLTEIDIQTLDFFTPVYIQKYSCYFYISKITDFTGVKPVKVELIRL